VIASREQLKAYVGADLERLGHTRWRARYRLTRRIAYFQWLLRRSEYWVNARSGDPVGRVVGAVLKLRVLRLGERLGFDVPRNVFGPGLSIAHRGLLVVNGDTRVGARCRIHHGVTLGGTEAGSPRIGDDVFIGPNAVVIGPVTVGDGAFIFPGAVVVQDVGAGMGAAGVPARTRPYEGKPWAPVPR
jgi:serine O-acetyltransferase